MSRVVRVVLAAVLAAAVGVLVLPGARADDAASVLERARNATVREDFSGTVQIEWLANGDWQTARVPVTGTGGTVQVGEGLRKAEGRGNERWIAGVSGWQAGWDEAVTGSVPAPSKHWDLALAKGDEIAGRPTLVVTATDPRTDQPRLKVYCDRDTGVMLRREVLDAKGHVVRAVGFVEVKKLGGTKAPAPADPPAKKSKDTAPTKVGALPSGFDAPTTVADRYVLAGRYLRPDGIVQLYYSDGLFGVSVFEQRGDLNASGLPRGSDAVAVGDAHGRGYEVAGGTVLVWDHADMTRTVVSDATIADLRTFAAAFDDRTQHHPGVVERVTDYVLGPFRWN